MGYNAADTSSEEEKESSNPTKTGPPQKVKEAQPEEHGKGEEPEEFQEKCDAFFLMFPDFRL